MWGAWTLWQTGFEDLGYTNTERVDVNKVGRT